MPKFNELRYANTGNNIRRYNYTTDMGVLHKKKRGMVNKIAFSRVFALSITLMTEKIAQYNFEKLVDFNKCSKIQLFTTSSRAYKRVRKSGLEVYEGREEKKRDKEDNTKTKKKDMAKKRIDNVG